MFPKYFAYTSYTFSILFLYISQIIWLLTLILLTKNVANKSVARAAAIAIVIVCLN